MAKKLSNKQKGYLAGAGALGLFLLYGGTAKAKNPPGGVPLPDEPNGGGGGGSGGGGGGGSGGGGGGGGSTSSTLQKGSSGKAVREWQRKIGYLVTEKDINVWPVTWTNPQTGEDYIEWGSDWKSFDDGSFGDTTKGMTKIFQQYNGLNQDGVVGTQTRKKMSEAFQQIGGGENTIAATPLKSFVTEYP